MNHFFWCRVLIALLINVYSALCVTYEWSPQGMAAIGHSINVHILDDITLNCINNQSVVEYFANSEAVTSCNLTAATIRSGHCGNENQAVSFSIQPVPFQVPFTVNGSYYFTSSTGNDCANGLWVVINVVDDSVPINPVLPTSTSLVATTSTSTLASTIGNTDVSPISSTTPTNPTNSTNPITSATNTPAVSPGGVDGNNNPLSVLPFQGKLVLPVVGAIVLLVIVIIVISLFVVVCYKVKGKKQKKDLVTINEKQQFTASDEIDSNIYTNGSHNTTATTTTFAANGGAVNGSSAKRAAPPPPNRPSNLTQKTSSHTPTSEKLSSFTAGININGVSASVSYHPTDNDRRRKAPPPPPVYSSIPATNRPHNNNNNNIKSM